MIPADLQAIVTAPDSGVGQDLSKVMKVVKREASVGLSLEMQEKEGAVEKTPHICARQVWGEAEPPRERGDGRF